MTEAQPSTLARIIPVLVVMAAIIAAYVVGRAAAHSVRVTVPRMVYRPAPNPTAAHNQAGVLAADRIYMTAVTRAGQAGHNPLFPLGFIVSNVTPTDAAILNWTEGVYTDTRTAYYMSMTVRFRWTGHVWQHVGQVFIQNLGHNPSAYAKFVPFAPAA